MMSVQVVYTLLALTLVQQERLYDSRGNSLGTSTTQGAVTTLRDARGNVISTTTTQEDVTTVRDAQGNVILRTRRHKD